MTEITLKEYLLDIIEEMDKRYQERFIAQKEAVDKALASNDRRLDGMNEFRATLKDQQLLFITKAEVETKYEYLAKEIAGLRESRSEGQGKGVGLKESLGYILFGIAVIGFFISKF